MIQVVDQAIPTYLQDFYELAVFGKSNDSRIKPLIDFQCKFEKTASNLSYTPLTFVHLLKNEFETSSHFSNFYQIVDIFSKATGSQIKKIYNGRIFLSTPHDTDKSHYLPHVDLNFPHLVVLYYINDADGSTKFFDQNGNVIKEVEPKKGRMVIFDGSIKHAAGIPKTGHRGVVNFSIEI